MKLTVEREAFLKPLQAVMGVVEKRQTMAILANVLLKLDGNTLSVIATDLEVEMVAKTEGVNGESGAITVPGKKLLDICRSLPDSVSITFETRGNQVEVTSGRSRFTLTTLPAEEFPNIESKLGQQSFSIAQNELLLLLRKTHFAMAQQDVRYFLNGLLLEVTDKYVRSVATDGHRLAMSTLEKSIVGVTGKTQVIIPRKAVLEFIRLLEDDDKEVTIALGQHHLRAENEGFVFTTKLLDGRYPDYNRVIPGEGENMLVTGCDSMRQTLSRTAILSNEKHRGIRLQFASNVLTLVANNPEQEEAQDELDVTYKGQEMEIGFNVNYLLDVLSVVEDEQVQISLGGSNASALIRGDKDASSIYVVMPIRL